MEVERGQLALHELVMGWRWGGQESRKQEDSRQLVVSTTAAETQQEDSLENILCSLWTVF